LGVAFVLQAVSWLPRAQGAIRLGFARGAARTNLAVLHQAGVMRARFPRTGDAGPPEAVLINTAGGLTGGDDVSIEVALDPGAAATVTTAAAEKIYRAREGEVAVRVRLRAGAGASLAWLPQPAILFDQASLRRSTEIDLAENARLLAAEALIFGRAAMGETMHRGRVRDAWRIRRGGRLVLADAFRVEGAVARALQRPAACGGARAAATLFYVGPDAQARLDAVRVLLRERASNAGASLVNGVLLVRLLAAEGRALQQDLAALGAHLHGRPMPRVWQC
jgi:urease accessory protein